MQSPPKNVSAEKLPKKVARLWRTLLNSKKGIQCTQKLHVHVDFYTQKIVKIRSTFHRMKGSHKANIQGISPPIMCAPRRSLHHYEMILLEEQSDKACEIVEIIILISFNFF